MHLLAILGQLQTERTDFPTFSYTVTGEIPTLSWTWSPEKGTPFGRSLPIMRPLYGVPPPPPPSENTVTREKQW